MARRKMMQIRLTEEEHAFYKTYCTKKGVTMTQHFASYLRHLRRIDEGLSMKEVVQL